MLLTCSSHASAVQVFFPFKIRWLTTEMPLVLWLLRGRGQGGAPGAENAVALIDRSNDLLLRSKQKHSGQQSLWSCFSVLLFVVIVFAKPVMLFGCRCACRSKHSTSQSSTHCQLAECGSSSMFPQKCAVPLGTAVAGGLAGTCTTAYCVPAADRLCTGFSQLVIEIK